MENFNIYNSLNQGFEYQSITLLGTYQFDKG